MDYESLVLFVGYVITVCFTTWFLSRAFKTIVKNTQNSYAKLYDKVFSSTLSFDESLNRSYDTRVKLIDEALLKISELYTALQSKTKSAPRGNKRKRTAEEKRQASEKAKARWALKKLKQPQPLDRTEIDMTNMQT